MGIGKYGNERPMASILDNRLVTAPSCRCLVIASCRSVIPTLEIPIDPTPTPSGPSKQVSATTLPFVERWRRSGIISGPQHPPNVVAAQGRTSTEDDSIHWAQQFEWPIYLWPIFMEDRVILNGGGQLYALDSATGKVIWQSGHEFITGPTRQDDLIYVVRSDVAIVAFDLETGEEVGSLKMTPNRTTEDDGGYILHYAIDASDKLVAVYYGNSQELIVFEKVNGMEDIK